MNTKKQLAVVTGGAGFVGSHLCERLVKESYHVISLDNYFTGTKENHVDGAEHREGHTKDIKKHVSEVPDIIFHLGEYSRVEKSLEEPDVVWDLNMDGTFGVLEFWRQTKCRLVYAGSSTKFSDGGLGRDLTPYTWTKAANTELVRNYAAWYGLSHATTYFYNVYGPRERAGSYGTVIEIFRQKYKNGEPLSVTAPGTQERNFTHVFDTVEGLLLVGEDGEGDNFGIGSNKSYSILEVAKMFGGEIQMMPESQGNRMMSVVDSQKVRNLGWEPKENLEEYIEKNK